MPTLKLHYDGWLALPADLRQKLGLNSGDRVNAELVDGTLVLKPAAKTRKPTTAGATAVAPVVDAPATLPLDGDAAPARRKPGRPREITTVAGNDAPTPTKARGRPRRAALAQKPDTAASPKVDRGPAKLVKKADLAAKTISPDVSAPAINPVMRIKPDRASQPVERRPFRNVEIRPIGPGRRQHQP